MPLQPLKIPASPRDSSLLSPVDPYPDSASCRSDQDSDSDDDELQLRARNSRELRAHDRLVFMEDEETDKLVIDARRKQERQQRRGSGLPIPNPLALLSRRHSDGSRSRSPFFDGDGADNDTAEGYFSEKGERRRQRRERRMRKKERLLAEARNGEDGGLMYEMEEGGMKDGSETGESSERDDSEEVDRRGLQSLADAKTKRRRGCCRWALIFALIATAFTILVLVAWKLSLRKRSIKPGQGLVSNGTALFAPTTIIISLDGFRADFLQRGLTPTLNAFIKEGVSPLYMTPSFPSVTFPNHYTLVTGLYPESHGVVGNTFWDPELEAEFYYTDPARSQDPKWWGGEPFWATAEKAGIRTAIHMWPGSEAHILGIEPSYVDRYNGAEALYKKVDRLLEFLDKPGKESEDEAVGDQRPQLIAAYVPNVDADGHLYGPNSTEIRSTIQNADTMLDQLFKGLEERNLTQIVNIIVVSDHGMATTDTSRLLQTEDVIDVSKVAHVDGWPLLGIRPKNIDGLQGLYEEAKEKLKDNPNYDVYLRDVDMPERYHFSQNDRIAPLWIVPKVGYGIVQKAEFDVQAAQAKSLVYHPRGLHGYDHEHPLMRAIFIARGPAFPHQPNSRLENFQNIQVYNILCDSVGLEPKPNNGTWRLPLSPIGLHDAETAIEEPADPPTHTLEPTSSVGSQPMPTSNPVVVDPVVVDPVVVDPVDSEEPSDTPSGDGDDGQKGGGGEDDDKSASAVEAFWGWFTHKLDDLWHKVTGNGDKSGETTS